MDELKTLGELFDRLAPVTIKNETPDYKSFLKRLELAPAYYEDLKNLYSEYSLHNFNSDEYFEKLVDVVKKLSFSELRTILSNNMKQNHDVSRILRYIENYDFWGSTLGEFVDGKAKLLHEHIDDLKWLYYRLADERSKFTLSGYVASAMFLNDGIRILYFACDSRLNRQAKLLKSHTIKEYFDPLIFEFDENDFFVDCGAYTCDTLDDYLNLNPAPSRYIGYEIDAKNADICEKKLSGLKNYYQKTNAEIRRKGVSDKKRGGLYIQQDLVKDNNSANRLSNDAVSENNIQIQTVSLDEDLASIPEKVTFLKMDIEGSEQFALRGFSRRLQTDKPKLALSIYHNNEDIYKIPQMVDEIVKNQNYKFYIQYNGGNLIPTEISLLGVYCEDL